MPKIHVTDREGGKHTIELNAGESVFEPLREIDGGIEALCGGMCSCATCHIFVGSEWADKIPAPQDDELELLEETECYREGASRLSCQVIMSDELDGAEIEVAPEE